MQQPTPQPTQPTTPPPQVLGEETDVPNMPNTGAGGGALQALLTLIMSAIVAGSGLTALNLKMK
jgi:hypothetical protein